MTRTEKPKTKWSTKDNSTLLDVLLKKKAEVHQSDLRAAMAASAFCHS
jgi:hypothetical protein